MHPKHYYPLFFSFLTQSTTGLSAHARYGSLKDLESLQEDYDFIVVGAGTAGLTIADRISENGRYTVLAVEYGYLDSSPDVVATGPGVPIIGLTTEPYEAVDRLYNITSAPLTGLSSQRATVYAGCLVGGSSGVNGMVFDRGTAEDYDSWVWAAGDKHRGEYEKEWGWNNLLPWFKKSITFDVPSEELAKRYGYTWDIEAAYGDGSASSIHASYPPFQWPAQQKFWDAFKAVPGLEIQKEGAGGKAVGLIWTPNSIDSAKNRTRSYAKLAHFDYNGVSTRKNFDLLPGHRVTQVVSERASHAKASPWVAKGVLITPRDGPFNGPKYVKAKREVIISAGPVHTPQVLQRSGFGPRGVLEAAGVEIKLELPGVGANLQDHMGVRIQYNFTNSPLPNEDSLTNNPAFLAEANELWAANHTGPLAAYFSSMAMVPLPLLSNRTKAITARLLSQQPGDYLPNNTHATVLAGYREQQKALARQYESMESAAMEVMFIGRPRFPVFLLKPTSRGRIYISPTDDGVNSTGRGNDEPIVDWRTLTNPVDGDMTVDFVQWIRGFMKTPIIQAAFSPIEILPGPNITDATLLPWIRSVGGPSNGHIVGTAALGPLELGGVVGPDLTVHGTIGLSVADNSVIPIIPGTHTSSTAYAIGEKAADLILKRAAGTR